MAASMACRCVLLLALIAPAAAVPQSSLLQTWSKALDSTSANPVARVVNLLKEMAKTLQKEMDEDEDLYKKLACWCNTNEYEKNEAISEAEAKIAELEALIESLTAKVAELKAKIEELEAQVAADKKALAEATALREKQIQEFHGAELDNIQAIENLKAAITILGKHHGGNLRDAFPQLSLSLLALDSKDSPFSETQTTHNFDEFMRRSDLSTDDSAVASHNFLQQESPPAAAQVDGWSSADMSVVKKALKSASMFVQAHHGSEYYPSYAARSGEIMGVLKQLKEEMEGDLGDAQKTENERAAAFAELRAAKTQEIEAGEKMAEQKEDELAQAQNDLAEAKEDLGQTQDALSEEQKFMMNLKKTCAEADANFNTRKKTRLSEMQAVAETIQILTQDEARDAMEGTYSFLQLSNTHKNSKNKRMQAARLLRSIAARTRSPGLIALATSVELDAFTRVKKAIDDMIAMLKQQQIDEVTKHDWCNAELQETEMTTMKTEDLRADLVSKVEVLTETIKRLGEEIEAAKSQIAELQQMLQRASEDRQAANHDFQTTLADQMATQVVLEKALDRLATYYDKAALMQRGKQSGKQTPPVPQMEYKPSSGATGVMQMIEKLIYEAKDLQASAKQGESEDQAAYEATVADTNASVAALQAEVVAKTKAKSEAEKEKLQTESDLNDAVDELERLSKYTADLHAECDYLLKNFDIRQEGRAQEIEALQQAKQILSGADFS
jgi:chaperonin cofactor prefoldin